jgi:hypothetical protein
MLSLHESKVVLTPEVSDHDTETRLFEAFFHLTLSAKEPHRTIRAKGCQSSWRGREPVDRALRPIDRYILSEHGPPPQSLDVGCGLAWLDSLPDILKSRA